MVVYGTVARNREEALGPSAGVTYRTLADVREQLRRRFEPTGAPVWIAPQAPNPLRGGPPPPAGRRPRAASPPVRADGRAGVDRAAGSEPARGGPRER